MSIDIAKKIAQTDLGGRYQVASLLGEGVAGEVYLLTGVANPEELRALKVIPLADADIEFAGLRVKQEVEALRNIDHPQIVRICEFIEDPEAYGILMEYVDGESLVEVLSKGPYGISECVRILQQLIDAIYALHSVGVIHRDLSPSNILISEQGGVKITDLGVARMLESSKRMTLVDNLVGTAQYMAPEYIETGECDQRADIYAWGILGYELITGRGPYREEGLTLRAFFERLSAAVPKVQDLRPECPESISAVIAKAMCPRVLERFSSVTELEQAFRNALERASLDEQLS